MRKIFILSCVLCLYACSPSPAVMLYSDEFHETAELNGISNSAKEYIPLNDVLTRIWSIQTAINKKTHQFHHRMYVSIKYHSDLKYFEFASDDKEKKLHLYTIYRMGGRCGTDNCLRKEDVAVDLTDADLRSHLNTGYKIIIESKSGLSYVFTLTPQMIRLQLEALSKYLKSGPVKNITPSKQEDFY